MSSPNNEDRQHLCSYHHFPIVKYQTPQRTLFVFQRRITRACAHRLTGCRYLNRVLVTIPENEDACLLTLALLAGLADKIALWESTRMTLVSLTNCPGFRFSMHQLHKQILGTSRTCLSYPLKNVRCLSDLFVAERPRHVRCRSLLHPPHLRCHIHLLLFPRWNMLLGTHERRPE